MRAVTLDRPDGWITFDVSAEPGDDGEGLCVFFFFFAIRYIIADRSVVVVANRFTRTFSKSSSSRTI